MQGTILDYSVQENVGTITGNDGARYKFAGDQWRGDRPPARGMTVDFEGEAGAANDVYIAVGTAGGSGSKDKVAAGLLAIFLGGLGIHKFYLGFTGAGLVFLLTNTVGWLVSWMLLFLPNIVLGVIALIEGIIYLTKTDEQFQQEYVVEKRQWF